MQIFVRNLISLIKKQKISQDELSQKTGIPISSLSRLLGGVSQPNKEAINLLAEAVGLSVDEIIRINPKVDDLDDKKEKVSFTEMERQIILAYRQLPDDHWLKKAIDETLLSGK